MKIALITGASSGMGREFVRLAAGAAGPAAKVENYDEIWLIARRRDRLKSLAKQYKDQPFRILALDLCKAEDRNELEKELKALRPRIGLLVHCAGFGVMGRVDAIPPAEQLEMTELNCKSLLALSCMALPYMARGGRMIVLASAAAFVPQPGFAVYAASKAFTLSFVRALGAEIKGRHICVTAVCPGAVNTEFFSRAGKYKKLPAYKKLVMADPKKVVQKAWKDSLAGRSLSVYGLPMKLFLLAAKLLPQDIFISISGKSACP